MKEIMLWQPIKSIPLDEEVHLRWPDGATAIGMLMSPPPIEICADRTLWWGVDARSYADGDWMSERENHQPDTAIEWAVLERVDEEDCCPI